jgi:hypothetical protein
LLSGKNESENINVRKLVSDVSRSIEKSISLVEVPKNMFPQEKILIWSLGLDVEQIHEAHLVVLHGKCKRIGPGLIGKGITSAALHSILSVLEADCECGLDRNWMMGAILPVIWDQEKQHKVITKLGFDAENPMVKMEVSRILGQYYLPRQTSPSFRKLPEKMVEETTGMQIIFNHGYTFFLMLGIGIISLLGGLIIVWYARRRQA